MTDTDKNAERISEIAKALMPYLPPDTAAVRAVEIEGVLSVDDNGQNAREALWTILGRLDDHPNVSPQMRGMAIEAVLHAWGGVNR